MVFQYVFLKQILKQIPGRVWWLWPKKCLRKNGVYLDCADFWAFLGLYSGRSLCDCEWDDCRKPAFSQKDAPPELSHGRAGPASFLALPLAQLLPPEPPSSSTFDASEASGQSQSSTPCRSLHRFEPSLDSEGALDYLDCWKDFETDMAVACHK